MAISCDLVLVKIYCFCYEELNWLLKVKKIILSLDIFHTGDFEIPLNDQNVRITFDRVNLHWNKIILLKKQRGIKVQKLIRQSFLLRSGKLDFSLLNSTQPHYQKVVACYLTEKKNINMQQIENL